MEGKFLIEPSACAPRPSSYPRTLACPLSSSSTTPRPAKALAMKSPPNGYRRHGSTTDDDGTYHTAAADMPDLSCPTNPLLPVDSGNGPATDRVIMTAKVVPANDRSPQLPGLLSFLDLWGRGWWLDRD